MPRRLTTALIAFGLLLGLSPWLPGSSVEGNAPNAGSHSDTESDTLAVSWTRTGYLNLERSLHTATLLPDGKVLVYGGISFNTVCVPLNCHPNTFVPLYSAELYDPGAGAWAPTDDAFYERVYHTATLLSNGRVLVAGGTRKFEDRDNTSLNASELYDPTAGTWYATGPLQVARYRHTATLLPNGKVLVVGGSVLTPTQDDYLRSAELYDPVTQVWTPTGDLNTGRYGHTATLLPSGKVLVVGGAGSTGYLNSAELYDPAVGTWTDAGGLFYERYGHTATMLQSGKVLVAGGRRHATAAPLRDVELYDPAFGWYTVGGLRDARSDHTASLLPNGKVLVAGGLEQTDEGELALQWAELFNPVTLVWEDTDFLSDTRESHTATLLSNGTVLAAGGAYRNFGWRYPLDSAELYDSTIACSTIRIYPQTLPLGTAGAPYSQTFAETGSSGTTVWQASIEMIPSGLTLDAATGVLSGIPAVGTYDFTVRATNGTCFGESAYTLEVQALSVTTVTASPNPVAAGASLTLTARVTSPGGGTPTGTVRFVVYRRMFTIPLVDGTATLETIAPLESGKVVVSASYSGDGDYRASRGSLTLEVY